MQNLCICRWKSCANRMAVLRSESTRIMVPKSGPRQGATTGCHGRVPRGFDSKRNPLFCRLLGLKIFVAGAEGAADSQHRVFHPCRRTARRPGSLCDEALIHNATRIPAREL